MKLVLGDWDTLREGARKVRYEVFVVEQKVPIELEWDDMDAQCVHALMSDESGTPLATGRLLPDGHIGRMAVLEKARGAGLGGRILEALIAAARERGDSAVMLNAQTHAEPFYARFGFERDGEAFMEAGIPHIAMRRHLA